jgi:hypothetical protein
VRVGLAGPEAERTGEENPYVAAIVAHLAPDGDGVGATLGDVLGNGKTRGLSALVIDQFEELFTAHPSQWERRAELFDRLDEALDRDPSLRLVLAIREDYLAQLDPLSGRLTGGLRTRFRLERLNAERALAAVERPLEHTERRFAPGVAESLVAELRRFRADTGGGETVEVVGEFVEPVQLQVVCQGLWVQLPKDVTEITQEHVTAFGDVNEVLARFYDEAVAAAAVAAGMRERKLRTEIERTFVTSMGTRGTAYRTGAETASIPNAAIDELERRHLVRGEWRAGARWYELTHDRFIEPLRNANAAFGARWVRKRLLLALGLVVALVLLAAGIFVSLVPRQGAEELCGSCEAQLQREVVERNVSYRQYIARQNLRPGIFPPAQLRRNGVLLHVNSTFRGGKGRRYPIAWRTVDGQGRVLTSNTNALVIQPQADLDTTLLSIWIPYPTAAARDVFSVIVEVFPPGAQQGGQPLDSIITNRIALPARIDVRLSLTVSGRGRVLGSGLDCGGPRQVCSTVAGYGTTITLQAIPQAGWTFAGWQGACGGSTPACSIAAGPVTSIAASFRRAVG